LGETIFAPLFCKKQAKTGNIAQLFRYHSRITLPMPTAHEHLNRVVAALSDGLLAPEEETAIVDICHQAWQDVADFVAANPDDFGWFLDLGYNLALPEDRAALTGQLMTYLLLSELGDLMAEGDKVDEIHEKVIELFDDSTLPDFPYDLPAAEREPQYRDHSKMGGEEYLRWLDRQIQLHHPDFQMLVLDSGLDDNITLCPVARDQINEVLASCHFLGIRAKLD
jgi:hypothetical protein